MSLYQPDIITGSTNVFYLMVEQQIETEADGIERGWIFFIYVHGQEDVRT